MFTLLFYLLYTRQEINKQKRRNGELNGQLNEERQAREEVLLDSSHEVIVVLSIRNTCCCCCFCLKWVRAKICCIRLSVKVVLVFMASHWRVETPVIGHYREREKCPLNRRFTSLIVTDTTLTRASFFKWNERFLPHIEVSRGRGSLLMFGEFLPRQLTFYFSLIPFAVGVQSSFTRSFKVWSSIQKQEQMHQTLR